MKFVRESVGDANLIRGWDAGRLRINERTFGGDVIVSAEVVIEVELGAPDALDRAALQPALDMEPEVLLVGTGDRQRFPAPALMQGLASDGVGLEVMDTIAAARTFNVLVSEGRRVVAVLYAPDR